MLAVLPFFIISLGFFLLFCGLLLRGYVDSPENIPPKTAGRLLALTAIYLFFLGVSVGIQRWVWNRHPDLFAAHHLLCALELMLKLRPNTSENGDSIDISQVRRHTVTELGQAAKYMKRMIGRRHPFVGPVELDNARKRATQIAGAISGYQETVIYGSLAEISPLIPAVSRSLAALVEQRFGDLPRNGASLPDDPGEYEGGAPERNPDSRADSSGERPHQPPSGNFRPDDVDTFRQEMARIYISTADAEPVLTRAGFPRERRPNIDYHQPDVAWEQIFRDLENGIIEDPYRTLLARALESYPANPVFTELAHRYDLPVPPGPRKEITRRIRRKKPRGDRPEF